MRKIAFIAAGILAGVVIIGVVLVLFFDVNRFREPIRAQLEKRLGRSVSIGKLGLKLVPLAIRLDDVTVGESPKFPSQAPFLTAKEMYVRVAPLALLRKEVDVESLQIVQPQVELIRNAAGEWNTSTLAGDSSAKSKSAGGSSVDLADVRIEDGRIAVTDLQAKKPRAVYDHVDIGLRDYLPGKRFQLDAQVHLPAQGKELVIAKVSADTPAAGQSFSAASLDGDVSLEAVSLAGLQAFLGTTPSQAAKAVFNGKAHFQSRGGIMTGKGNVEVSEPRLKQPAQIAFDVRDDSQAGVLTVSSASLKVGALAAHGTARVHTKETPSTITGDFRTDNAAVADLLQLASALGLAEGISGTGVVSLAAHVSGPADAPAYEASGTLRDAKLSLEPLRKPVEIQSVTLKLGKDQAELDSLTGSLGSSHLHGNISVRDFARPDLQFNLDIDQLDTAELEQIVAPSENSRKGGSGGPKALTGSGTVTVGTIKYNQIALNNVRATCKLENGLIRLDPLTAKVFGGDQAGSIAVDTRQQTTAFDVRSRLQGVDARQLLAATTSIRQVLSGLISGQIDLRANPQKGEEMARALNGTVQMQLTNGKLGGVQLLNEAAGVAKFLGYAARNENFTNIVKLAGTLHIQNGVANTNDLQLQFDEGSMAAEGTIGLADQTLKLHVTTVLPKAVSQRAGSNQIAGFMSTALANSKGELVIPAIVSGTFDKPRFEPDPQRIAKMKLDGFLPTHDNPLAPVSKIQGLLGALTGGKSADSATPDPKKKAIVDILNSLGKQK